MKNSNFYYSMTLLFISLLIFSCNKDEDGQPGQTIRVEFSDDVTNQVLANATVELYADFASTSANGKYSGQPPLLSGVTNENGEVFFSKAQFESLFGITYPVNFTVYIKKDFYSNIHSSIQSPDVLTLSSGNTSDQNTLFVVKLSMVEVFAAPTKWNYKRTLVNDIDITSTVSECSKDNYFTAFIAANGTDAVFQMVLNEGTNDCGIYDYVALMTPIGNLNYMPVFEDGYVLPSSVIKHGFQGSNTTATGFNIFLEVKSDSLFYSSQLNGDSYLSVYVPEL